MGTLTLGMSIHTLLLLYKQCDHCIASLVWRSRIQSRELEEGMLLKVVLAVVFTINTALALSTSDYIQGGYNLHVGQVHNITNLLKQSNINLTVFTDHAYAMYGGIESKD